MNNVIYFGNLEGCDYNSDLLLYILKLLNWEKLLRFVQSRCAHHAGGILFEKGRSFPEYIMELAALKTTENLLESSCWTGELVQAGVAACGKADSFLKASHITPTWRAH